MRTRPTRNSLLGGGLVMSSALAVLSGGGTAALATPQSRVPPSVQVGDGVVTEAGTPTLVTGRPASSIFAAPRPTAAKQAESPQRLTSERLNGSVVRARSYRGSEYAGSFVDQDGRLVLAFAGREPLPSASRFAEDSADAENIIVVARSVSLARLQELQGEVLALARKRGRSATVSTSLNQVTGAVDVYLGENNAELRAEMHDAYGDLVTLSTDTLLGSPEEGRGDPSSMWKAGKSILPGGPCTSGFVWTKGSWILGSTAGHCGILSQPPNTESTAAYIGGVFYGFGYGNTYSYPPPAPPVTASDIVFIKGPDPYNYTPNVIYIADGYSRKVDGKNPNPISSVGSAVCISGLYAGKQCAKITATEVSVPAINGAKEYQSLTCASYMSFPGDSGSPIFQERPYATHAIAIGMHVLSRYNGRTGERVDACYYDVDNLERVSGVQVLTY